MGLHSNGTHQQILVELPPFLIQVGHLRLQVRDGAMCLPQLRLQGQLVGGYLEEVM